MIMNKIFKTLVFFLTFVSVLSLTSCGVANIIINFDSNGGTLVESTSSLPNRIIEFPEDPTKDGFQFSGWYLDNNTFEIMFNSTSLIERKIREDFTLYARWLTPFEAFYSSINSSEYDYSSEPLGPFKIHNITNYNGDYKLSKEIRVYKNGNDIQYSYRRVEGRILNSTIYENTFTTTIKTQIDNIQKFDIIMTETRVNKPPNGPQRTTVSVISRANNSYYRNFESVINLRFDNNHFNLEKALPRITEFYNSLISIYPNVLNN